ncbi:MAG: hypothetical protein G8D28_06285 [gamma proteobacterium symbiont of Phacoides pectinatus]
MGGKPHDHRDEHPQPERIDLERRAFLRKSRYLAYTTPAILNLVIERASAGTSYGDWLASPCCNAEGEQVHPGQFCNWENWGGFCEDLPDHPFCKPRSD